jgi:hypothetical protein
LVFLHHLLKRLFFSFVKSYCVQACAHHWALHFLFMTTTFQSLYHLTCLVSAIVYMYVYMCPWVCVVFTIFVCLSLLEVKEKKYEFQLYHLLGNLFLIGWTILFSIPVIKHSHKSWKYKKEIPLARENC